MTLTWVAFAALAIVAAPLTRARLALWWGLVGGFVLVLLLPTTRSFFALELPPLIVWLAGIGIAALVWSAARLFVPGSRPVGRAGDLEEG
jgi:cation-transporting ATPase E